jgi:hypothetical protein
VYASYNNAEEAIVTFLGHGIDERIILRDPAGQPLWQGFVRFQLLLASFQKEHPRQLSQRLFRHFTWVTLTVLQSNGESNGTLNSHLDVENRADTI